MLLHRYKNKVNDKHAINRAFFKRVFMLCKPYWTRKGAWASWCVLIFLLFTVVGFSLLGGYMTWITAKVTDLQLAKDNGYWLLWGWLVVLTTLNFFSRSFTTWIGALLGLHWRRWLTAWLVSDYLSQRTYYRINQDKDIDNPDQRIQEQVKPFCETLMMLPASIVGSLMNTTIQIAVLATISTTMIWGIVIYALIYTLGTLYIYRPQIQQQWNMTISEASLRAGILQVRDHAENIAFYNGEESERRTVAQRLGVVNNSYRKYYHYNNYISLYNLLTNNIVNILPLLFVVPLFFNREISYGVIAQAGAASALLIQNLTVVTEYIPTLTKSVPYTVRLAEIHEKLQDIAQQRHQRNSDKLIAFRSGREIELIDLSLMTPGGDLPLVKNLFLHIAQGEHLLIMGETGVGKSSLLRSIARLWESGTGTIITPETTSLFFLPQSPYLVAGSLRSQLIYPAQSSAFSDDELLNMMSEIGAAEVLEKHGGLNVCKNWAKELSLGEQQMISAIRVLVNKPRYVFMDEATSALDISTERRLFTLLLQANVTLVSVGHRHSIKHYHRRILYLYPQGRWRIEISPKSDTTTDKPAWRGAV